MVMVYLSNIKFQQGFPKLKMFVSVLTENRLYFVIVSWFSGNFKIIVNPVFAHCTIRESEGKGGGVALTVNIFFFCPPTSFTGVYYNSAPYPLVFRRG